MAGPDNNKIAELLDRIADVLEVQDANPFRVRAYRDAATTIRYSDHYIADFVREDRLDDLIALPTIGEGIAAVVAEYVNTGRSNLLEEIEASAGPEATLIQVPGIGKSLAERIVDQIEVKTLEELELAAHDGRLETVEGFGPRRVKAVQTSLAGMLSRSTRRKSEAAAGRPSIELLLNLDAEYRQRAKTGNLIKIAPRRFNPTQEAWLPVMHVKREGWSFTLLFSNTAQAHKLDKTDDWVVIYCERDGEERQYTIVTETQGPLKGKRVVRGRNQENHEYYEVALA